VPSSSKTVIPTLADGNTAASGIAGLQADKQNMDLAPEAII